MPNVETDTAVETVMPVYPTYEADGGIRTPDPLFTERFPAFPSKTDPFALTEATSKRSIFVQRAGVCVLEV